MIAPFVDGLLQAELQRTLDAQYNLMLDAVSFQINPPWVLSRQAAVALWLSWNFPSWMSYYRGK